MSTRTTSRTVAAIVPTEAQARASLASYIEAHLKVEALEIKAAKLVEKLKKKYDDKARPIVAFRDAHETVLMQYAEGHPELFQKRQKVELYGGHKIGWHTSPPAVTFVRPTGTKKKQTVEGFLAAVKAFVKYVKKFVRTKEEINKEAIIIEYRATEELCKKSGDQTKLVELKADLSAMGVEVTQEEKFVIDLDLQPEIVQPAVATA
ncbi:host-nuclease inhibitor Gam family protein [Verrucomicrobium spinosum]|uniref:host-nuclease inhibitor Gam family protein n=1 Tax=Verrucomicrobium spinosum TaxID=2736 RepID=UPI00017463EF|nr:host-nuclease inhibitor Gam family protein [Verrucomicrobium spinosum]